MRQHETPEVAGGITLPAASATPNPARRYADEALVAALAAEDFEGSRWEKVSAHLMDYSWRVLTSWIATGRIFHECTLQGRGLVVRADAIAALSDPDVRYELATDTILKTLPKFRNRLIDGRWQASRSQLTTYFIGAAILEFPNVYRRWESRNTRESVEEPLGLAGEFEDVSRERGPAAIVADRDEVHRIVGTLPADLRKIIELKAVGYTTVEVASSLGLTPKAVERRLHRLRDRYTVANSTLARATRPT